MKVDLKMSIESRPIKEILTRDINPDSKKLEVEPYPSPLVLAQLASAVYEKDGGKQLPTEWKILKVYSNTTCGNGYVGAAYYEPSLQQVVIAHKGTYENDDYWTDFKGVVGNNYTSQMNSAITFSDRIMRLLRQVNKKSDTCFQLSVTGHSLGGWLAQVTAFTLKYVEVLGDRFIKVQDPQHDSHVHTVTFDSPGCRDMLEKIINEGYYRQTQTVFPNNLDITNYFLIPNRINTFHLHVGTIHKVTFDVSKFHKCIKFTLDAHKITNFIEAFTHESEIIEILDWPMSSVFNWREYKYYYKMAKCEKSYIPDTQGEEQQDTWEIDLRYKSNNKNDYSCNTRIFSEKELHLLKLWTRIERGKLRMNCIDKFVEKHKLRSDLFPKFKIENKRMSCDTEQDVRTVIRHIKQLVRCFCKDFTEAMEQQGQQILKDGVLMYQTATEKYLEAIPECHLHFEDTIGLKAFLESKYRTLQIVTEDSQFEVAKLRDLLKKLQQEANEAKSLDYFLTEDQSFMEWKQIEGLEKTINFEKIYISEFNLIVIDCSSLVGISGECEFFLKRILDNIDKKIIYIMPSKSEHELFSTSLFDTVNGESVGLIHLTEESQERFFKKKMLTVEGKKLSWKDYAGEQNLKSFLNFIKTSIDKQMFKKIVTDRQYATQVKNPLSNDLLVHSSIPSSELNMTRVAKVIRECTPKPLLVISGVDREKLRTEKWKELIDAMGQDADENIFPIMADGEDTFKQICRKHPRDTVFCLTTSTEGIFRTHLYREELYMKRQFHESILLNLQEFAQNIKNDDALYVFQNVNSKEDLIRLLPEGTGDTFLNGGSVITAASADVANEIVNKNGNKPVHVMERVADAILWRHSWGSLDGLRPYMITGDAKTEGDLSGTNLKAVIIADEPGMGKSTSLVSISRLLNESVHNWVIWIDLKHFKIPIDKLTPDEPKSRCEHLLRINIAKDINSIDNWQHTLLNFCLHHEHSKNIHLIFDGFDEVLGDSKIDTKKEVLSHLHYLINKTKARVWVTTRLNDKIDLENHLSTFAMTFKKIEEPQQREYLENFWRSHLLLETDSCEEAKLEECARDLYITAKINLGEGIQRFMGVPLQMRMLAEVFLPMVKDYVTSQKLKPAFEVQNVSWLYAKFTNLKYDIYIKTKTKLHVAWEPDHRNSNIANFTHSHRMLALRTLFPDFAKKHCEVTDRDVTETELCKIGLVQSRADGRNSIEFIHRTLAEYFSADRAVYWLSIKGSCHERLAPTVELLLTDILLHDHNNVIRIFINSFLLSNSITVAAQEFTAENIDKLWNEKRNILFNKNQQTALHVAIKEGNDGIIELLMGSLRSRPDLDGLIAFIMAHNLLAQPK